MHIDVSSLLTWLLVAVEIGLRIVALGVIPGNRKPSTGMAWLLLILTEPIIGFAIFLTLGRTRLEGRRMRRQRTAIAAIRAQTDPLNFDVEHDHISRPVATIAEMNARLGSLEISDGNNLLVLTDYEQIVAAMTAEIEQASESVDLEFYIVAWDELTTPLFEALERACARGVQVRLLYDHVGSLRIKGYRRLLRRLRHSGMDWHPMMPIQPLKRRFRRPDLRNHRKILVVDGRVGFLGSLNLIEPGYNKPRNHRLGRKWVELMVRVEGPVVAALHAVFGADWYVETGETIPLPPAPRPDPPRREAEIADVPCQIVPSGPGLVEENNLRMFTSLIYTATTRVSLVSPYFVPDESLLYAITTAADRGVAVELFVSEISDQFMVGHAQASYYRALLEKGVRIYLYPAPYVLHSKFFCIDDEVAVIGSSNMDMRSFGLNFEVSAMVPDPEVVSRLHEVQDEYRALSSELTLPEWDSRPRRLKYVDNLMRLTAALQ